MKHIESKQWLILLFAISMLLPSAAWAHKLTVTAKPTMAGTLNIDAVEMEAGETIHLFAYANANFTFLRWVDENGNEVSLQMDFTYVMPTRSVTLTAEYEYNPLNPANPASNYWDKDMGDVIVDDFIPGSLQNAVKNVIGDSKAADVMMITVAGIMNANDFGIINTYSACTLLDFSRVTGVTQVPSYAFDNTKLEAVYLPATIESIGTQAFYGCQQLSSMIIYAKTPPSLGSNVFTNVPEGLVIYVPAAAIAQYQDAAGWKNFTILPIQEDIRNISVSLPNGTNVQDYAQMWLELTNTKNGQRIHYVMTDRTQYTFPNIIRNTSWNVVLRNERGDVFGQIDNVEVKDDDVAVTFASLSKPQNVSLSVLTPDGKDVTEQVQVTWTDASGNYLAQSASLSGLPVGYQANYRVVLSQELAMMYNTPQIIKYTLKDGDNSITCQFETIKQVQLTGKVKDETTELPLSGAVISASQTFGGKYSKTQNTKTDKDGVFTITVSDVPTTLAFAASDYVSQTIVCDSFMKGDATVTLPDVSLRAITGANITIGFTYTSDDGETQNWYSDYQNVDYTLFNITKNQAISQYNVQYPQIVLLEKVDDGDVLKLTASSRTNAFKAVETTSTIADQKAEVTFAILELGKIQASFEKNGNASVVGSLYDASGKLVKTYNYSNASLTISNLADGQYTLVSMGNSRLFNTIYDLTQLPQTGLVDGTDYVKNAVEVKSGAVSTINIDEVPILDESKLYYTGDNTSFSVNKPSIVAGNYLTLTGHIDFKSAYATSVSNVQMIVDLPESCRFVENSVMVGNSTCSYTLSDNRIIIPMPRFTDRVRFCVIPTLGGEYAPSAFVQFDLDGETIMQPIGSANYTAKDLSISVPSTVAKTSLPVSGTAIGTSNVEIYDNGVLIGQTTSLANGTWATTCELNKPHNLSTHSINAKIITKQGIELQSEIVDCIYDMNCIEAKTVTMSFYNSWLQENVVVVFDFTTGKPSTSSYMFYTATDITFIVDLTNNDPEVVKDVSIYVYTDCGEIRKLKAEYDNKKDKWIAVSRFESYNLPVNLSIDIDFDTNAVPDIVDLGFSADNIETLSKKFYDDIAILEDFFGDTESITDEKLAALAQSLQINLSFDSDDSSIDGEVISMTDEELGAYLDILYDEMVVENDALIAETEKIKSWFELKSVMQETFGDGSVLVINTCDGLTREKLIAEGYEETTFVDGMIVYSHITEMAISLVILEKNILINIILPSDASARAMYNTNRVGSTVQDVWEKFMEINERLSLIIETINNTFDDIVKTASLPEEVLKDIEEKIIDHISNVERNIRMCTKPGFNHKKIKWMAEKYRLCKALGTVQLALPICKTIVGGILKALPVVDYVASIDDCIKNISTIFKTCEKIPDPCLNDEQNANKVRTECLILMEGILTFATLEVYGNFSADAEIVGGALTSVATAGTSLAVVGWGILKKVVIQIGKHIAKIMLIDKGHDLIKQHIKDLKCTKENNIDYERIVPPPFFDPLNPIHDPSGYVFEGVSSNRVEGVTATAYYKENVEDIYGDLHENIAKWDASEYAQENPLFTDEYGMYAWDVPQGLWQVKFEKEGYETTYSEWLPVPPPQLDVNIAMKQNVQPNVKLAHAFEDAVEVEFDKYMIPELLTTENVVVLQGNKPVEGTIELLNEEASYENNDETFASKVRFNAAQPFTAQEITLMVSNRVKSYAGIRMQDDFSQTFKVEQEIKQILCDSLTVVDYGGKSTLTVSVLPASASKGKTMTVKTSSPMILGVATEQVIIGEDGTAEISVSGELPGTAALTFSVEGTDKTALTIASVEQKIYTFVATPIANIASGSVVDTGTQITLSCETDGVTIYYTIDGSCPCDNASRIKYDGTPIVINEGVTIKVIAVAPNGIESDVAEYVYTTKDEEDAVIEVPTTTTNTKDEYDISGRKVERKTKGIIIRSNNGTKRKVLVK